MEILGFLVKFFLSFMLVVVLETLCVSLGWNCFLVKVFPDICQLSFGQCFYFSLALAFIASPIRGFKSNG